MTVMPIDVAAYLPDRYVRRSRLPVDRGARWQYGRAIRGRTAAWPEFAEEDDADWLVAINAWNKRTEGSYLLPDICDGVERLATIERVVRL